MVKTRLNEEPGNAKLWCALGDATGDETCYHKAWEVSGECNARSQRTLARLCAQRNDFAQADVHWTRALTLNPLFPGAWFNCGYCRMKCEGREDDALAAFVRCAQIDPENGQAWNNVAALSMHKAKVPSCTRCIARSGQALPHVVAHVGKLSHRFCENREIRRVGESVNEGDRVNRRS